MGELLAAPAAAAPARHPSMQPRSAFVVAWPAAASKGLHAAEAAGAPAFLSIRISHRIRPECKAAGLPSGSGPWCDWRRESEDVGDWWLVDQWIGPPSSSSRPGIPASTPTPLDHMAIRGRVHKHWDRQHSRVWHRLLRNGRYGLHTERRGLRPYRPSASGPCGGDLLRTLDHRSDLAQGIRVLRRLGLPVLFIHRPAQRAASQGCDAINPKIAGSLRSHIREMVAC
jgi:hypothetical protein